MKQFAPLFLLAALGACGRSDDGPGGVTAGEQKALDEAAEMIDSRQLDPSAIPPAPAQTSPAQTSPARTAPAPDASSAQSN